MQATGVCSGVRWADTVSLVRVPGVRVVVDGELLELSTAQESARGADVEVGRLGRDHTCITAQAVA